MNLAVVFVSYRSVPEERLQDHFAWNDAEYRKAGARVFAVSDEPQFTPEYAATVLFHENELPLVDGQRRFSLTKTKNRGLVTAIAYDADVIVCTDVDIRFPPGMLRSLASVDDETAMFPMYHMMDYTDRKKCLRIDMGCTGTTAMTAANWERIQYDERCVGYGGDDGFLLADCRAAGLRIDRSGRVDHIGHIPGDGDRVPGSGSASCWGRDDGFNFENIRGNKAARRMR